MSDFLPHLVLCDINLKEENDGITLIENLRQQYAFEIIFITSYQTKTIIERALQYQPLHYLIKPVDEATVLATIKLAWSLILNNPKLGQRKGENPIQQQLSNAEQKTTKEIAGHLCISPYTVKNDRHSICRKLKLNDGNNALLKWALEHKEWLV